MRQVIVLQRSALLVGGLAFACGGTSFSGEQTGAGAGGSSRGGTSSGASHGGDGVTTGGLETGGASSGGKASGGGGVTNGGHGGLVSVAGSDGRAGGGSGGGGGAIVETPPIPLAGLELWFRAEVGVTEVAGVVSKWEDASGNARHALQTATNLRPKLDAKGLNGKPALVFDGADDYLKLPTLPGIFSKGLTAFVVAQQDSQVDNCAGFFEASNGPEIDDVHVGLWQGAMLYEVADQYLHAPAHPALVGKPELIAVVHQASTAAQLRRNSASLGDSQFPLPVSKDREQVYIARTAYGECVPLPGRVGELLLYSRAVSDDELISIETYLQKKWACCSQ